MSRLFVFDPSRPPDDPFRIGLERDFRADANALDPSGFNYPLLLDGYMVVPAQLDPSQSTAHSGAHGP